VALLAVVLLALALPTIANAASSKLPVDFFGGSGGIGGKFGGAVEGVAVNQSGAGAGNPGDIYAVDTLDNRIERFARDDRGTPADGSDDTYSFISAWGVGVEPASGPGYEVCTVAEQCSEAIASGIAGGLSSPGGVAVDGDTGDVYVADAGNDRVDVYAGDGTFLRAFGFDVIASGPDDAGAGYEVCVPAAGDVCKAGVPGAGLGQVGGPITPGSEFQFQMGIAVSQPDGNPASGTVFLADRVNARVNAYHLDGSAPTSIGSSTVFSSGKFGESPLAVVVDSRGILYATNLKNDSEIERYDTEDADGGGIGFLAPIKPGVNEVQQIKVSATAGTFNLTYDGETTVDIPYDAPAKGTDTNTPGVIDSVEEALAALPALAGTAAFSENRVLKVSGGPGDAGGTSPYRIEFRVDLGAQNVGQITVADGATPLSGGSGADAGTFTQGVPGLVPDMPGESITVDPDSDGPGPDQDILYVQRSRGPSIIQQFGPSNAPGLTAPPADFDNIFGTLGTTTRAYSLPSSFALDEASGRIYVTAPGAESEAGSGVYVLGTPSGIGPSASLDSISDVTAGSVTVHATITPNGTPPLSYHLEYSTDGTNWESGRTVVLGTQSTPQSITEVLEPPGGLAPNTFYHLRLVAKRPFFPTLTTSEQTFTTLPSPPLVETTGSPVRSAGTARLDGRLSPQGSATTYHFEYGSEGPCDANPCTSTEAHSAGSGGEFELVSQRLQGLQAGTTYHYRLIADNGTGSPVAGEDMTVSTFTDDAPLSHGHFPGPPGSDRAWELASEPDTSGNPVGRSLAPAAVAISDDGERVVYGVSGGTPLSETGTFATRLYGERTAHGWETRKVFPTRQQATGAAWEIPGGPADLSTMVVENQSQGLATKPFSVWRLFPDSPPVELFGAPESLIRVGVLEVSEDGSRVLSVLGDTQDPAHPVAPGTQNLYDISTGQAPELIDLLPDGAVPLCGIPDALNNMRPLRSAHWLSADGSLAFFPAQARGCGGPSRIYLRHFATETTKLISGAAYSGELCASRFIKSNRSFAYFTTETRLTPEDIEPEGCANTLRNNDVYRYDLGNGSLKCLTCVIPGYAVGVGNAGVSEDGSHIYFRSERRLLPGAPAGGGSYLIDLAGGKLSYVGEIGVSLAESSENESMINPDGSVVAFRSKAATLDAIGGQQNGGTRQDYIYDSRDGSLTCVSCPADGSLPVGEVHKLEGGSQRGAGPNVAQPLDAGGEDFIFATSTPLVAADQNTARAGQDPCAGTDVYEWRGGRLLLVSDGITNWPSSAETPQTIGITPSGRDVFFIESAELTPDALDGYSRLYDARIGGGFEFPPPPKPCPLEVCQGTPKGAPEEQAPGTQYLQGAGNATAAKKAHKAKKPHKAKKHKSKARHKKKSRKAKHNRRTAR
jgi:hypothetical protein